MSRSTKKYSRFMERILDGHHSDPGPDSPRAETDPAGAAPPRTILRVRRPLPEATDRFNPTHSAVRKITDGVRRDRARRSRTGQLDRALSDSESLLYPGESFPNMVRRSLDRDMRRAHVDASASSASSAAASSRARATKRPRSPGRSRTRGLKGRRIDTPWGPVTVTPKKLNNQYMISTRADDYPSSGSGKWSDYSQWAKALKGQDGLKQQVIDVLQGGHLAVRPADAARWGPRERRAAASLYATIAIAESHRVEGASVLGMEALRSASDIEDILAGKNPIFSMAGKGGTGLTRDIALHRAVASSQFGEELRARAHASAKDDLGDEADDEASEDFSSGEDDASSEDEMNISGLRYQPVLADGHCLYHAIGLHLDKDQQQLRNEVADYIEANPEQFIELLEGLFPGEERTPASYAAAVRAGEEWGDDLEIQTLMLLFGKPIAVVGPEGEIRNPHQLEGFAGQDPIFVYYNGEDHYDALLLEEGANPQAVLAELQAGQPADDDSESEHESFSAVDFARASGLHESRKRARHVADEGIDEADAEDDVGAGTAEDEAGAAEADDSCRSRPH